MTEALLLTKSKQLRTSNDLIMSPKSVAILPPVRGKQCTVTILWSSASVFGGHLTEIYLPFAHLLKSPLVKPTFQ